MKTACIYHSIDLDGWMSAAIVKHWFIEKNKSDYQITDRNLVVEQDELLSKNYLGMYGYNYGEPIPDLSEYDRVIMCDISFPKEELLKVNTPDDRLIWIDHHASALKEFYETFDTIEATNKFFKGLRSDKYAACELTWKYFFPNDSMPEIVRLLGRYDCFGHKGTDEERNVLEFQYGARQRISNYEEAYKYLIQSFDPTNPDVENIQYRGSQIYQYLCTEAKQAYANGFPLILQQKVYETDNKIGIKLRKFICINKERFNPINFGIDYHADGYDGAACFHYDGKRKVWAFSLYNDNGKVDCSVIAKQFGGGGHKGAAGFVINDLTSIF